MPATINSFSGDYRFLSNFWYSPVVVRGVRYPTVEHAFQACKTLVSSERAKIAQAKTPGQAKRLGRAVKLREDWESIRLQVMEGCLRQKFRPGSELAVRLLATGDAELVEGNTWNDTYWGVCRGVGSNNLGKLLMKIREELRKG